MKKSKLLKNSKELLSRSFNPAKCKTALKLAGARLKLLRNKKEAQVKQIKREIAQLLESGQDRTARIRVEHVVREEKMMAAYDLIEIYCELIVARMQIIESQKICPIDLKEAIASILFASPRCGDVPELLDVKKHFTEKYGKDFIAAAIELRPQCGVNRLLVEKLSAKAPDGQTKLKILSAIAEEHNIKWDPESCEEKGSIPSSDLLNGPSTAEENELHVEPPHYESLDAQARQSNKSMHGSISNVSPLDHRNSLGKERLASAQTSGVNTAFHHEAGPPALGDERSQLFQGDSYITPMDQQRWNMEFKDATSAAQAAAESAELASMAARAAAELSNRDRIIRQYSTESHQSDVHILKDGGPETHANSKLAREQFTEEPSFSKNIRSQNEQVDGMKLSNLKTDGRKENALGGIREYSRSTSLNSEASSIHDNSVDNDVPVVDGYSQLNTLHEVSRGQMSMQRQSFKYKAETANTQPEKPDNVGEDRIWKQPSVKYSHSHSSVSDDMNIFSNYEDQKFKYDAGEDPFMGFRKAAIYGEASQTSSPESAAVVFNKSDSESGIHDFNMGPTYDEEEPGFHFLSSGQKSREQLLINSDVWSPGSGSSIGKTTAALFFTRKKSSDFSENLTSIDGSKLDDSVPVTYDESDGSAYESDEHLNMPKNTGIEDSRDLPREHNQSFISHLNDEHVHSVGSTFKGKESSGFDRKQLSFSSGDEIKSKEMDRTRNQGKILDADTRAKLSVRKPSFGQPDLEPGNSQMEFNDSGNSRPGGGDGLNFEKLTGGLRHKRSNYPPFLKNQFDVSSSFSKASEVTAATTNRSTAPAALESPRTSTLCEHKKSETMPNFRSASDSDSSEEEESLRKSSDHKPKLNTQRAGKEVKVKPSLAASNSIFGSDDSDFDEDPLKESPTKKSHLRSGISQRTKAPSSGFGKSSYSKMRLSSEVLDFDDDMEIKPTGSTSGTPKKYESWRNSSKLENYEQPTSSKVASKPVKSNFWGPPEPYNSGKATSVTKQESKIQIRSDVHDSDASGKRKPTTSHPTENRLQHHSFRKNSNQLGKPEGPTSVTVSSKPNSRLWGAPDQQHSGKANSAAIQESKKKTWNSSATAEPSRPRPKTESSISSENLKPAATLNKTSSNNYGSTQKPSHVHPKLPDYDTLVQSLRKNRS